MSLGCRISFSHRLVPKFENSVPRKRSYLTCQSAVGLFIKPRKKLKQPIACLLRSYHGGWYTKTGKLAMQYTGWGLTQPTRQLKYGTLDCIVALRIRFNKHPLFLSHNHGTWMAMVSIPNPSIKIIIGAQLGAFDTVSCH